MNDRSLQPTALEAIVRETADLGFSMASESQTGSLLRTLAASKPAGSMATPLRFAPPEPVAPILCPLSNEIDQDVLYFLQRRCKRSI